MGPQLVCTDLVAHNTQGSEQRRVKQKVAVAIAVKTRLVGLLQSYHHTVEKGCPIRVASRVKRSPIVYSGDGSKRRREPNSFSYDDLPNTTVITSGASEARSVSVLR